MVTLGAVPRGARFADLPGSGGGHDRVRAYVAADLAESIGEQIDVYSHLTRRMLAWRTHHLYADRRQNVAYHDGNELALRRVTLNDNVGQRGDTDASRYGFGHCGCVVSRGVTVRMDHACFLAERELPGLCSDQDSLMVLHLVRCLGLTALANVVAAHLKIHGKRSDAPRDKIAVRRVTYADVAIETLFDQVNVAIVVVRMYVERRMLNSHVCDDRSKMHRSKRRWRRYAEKAAQFAGWVKIFAGGIHFGAHPRRVTAKARSCLHQHGPAGRLGQQLSAKLVLKSSESPTDDRFSYAEPPGGCGHASRTSNLDKSMQVSFHEVRSAFWNGAFPARRLLRPLVSLYLNDRTFETSDRRSGATSSG